MLAMPSSKGSGKAEPDRAHVHHELRRPGVTLMLLWEEYRQREPDGYGYSRWCELYRAWEGRLSPTMQGRFVRRRQHRRPRSPLPAQPAANRISLPRTATERKIALNVRHSDE